MFYVCNKFDNTICPVYSVDPGDGMISSLQFLICDGLERWIWVKAYNYLPVIIADSILKRINELLVGHEWKEDGALLKILKMEIENNLLMDDITTINWGSQKKHSV